MGAGQQLAVFLKQVVAARLIKSLACKMSDDSVHQDNETLQARLYRVSGTVQGVGFRYFASRMARQLGINGYAKNLRDGRVEIYAIGTQAKLAAMRKELQRGPRSSVVSDVMEEEVAIQSKFENGFSIERDSYDV
jgi:acylphosphatase